MGIKYIGKCLLIEEGEERVLVVGDLHLGYERELNKGGIDASKRIQEELIEDFERIFGKVGKVDRVILLGDVKHYFGKNVREEWLGVEVLFRYLKEKCNEIVIVKGNHDNYLTSITNKERNIEVRDYYVWREYCFFHGNKDFEELYDIGVKVWVMGHVHPAVTLHLGVKEEKYKCFLTGKYKGKKIVILPSFFSGVIGSDVRESLVEIPWKFNFNKFSVKAIGDEGKIYDFGLLGRLW